MSSLTSTENIIIVTVVSTAIPAIIGLFVWYFKTKYTSYMNKLQTERDHKLEIIEEKRKKEINEQVERYRDKIKLFYYPIYIRLTANEHAYRKIIGPRRSETMPHKVRRHILKHEILPAHLAIIQLFKDYGYMIEGDAELLDQFIKFTHHVSVLKTIHNMEDINISARDVGSEYPTRLLPVLHDRFMVDTHKYNELMGYTVYQDNILLRITDNSIVFDDQNSSYRSEYSDGIHQTRSTYNNFGMRRNSYSGDMSINNNFARSISSSPPIPIQRSISPEQDDDCDSENHNLPPSTIPAGSSPPHIEDYETCSLQQNEVECKIDTDSLNKVKDCVKKWSDKKVTMKKVNYVQKSMTNSRSKKARRSKKILINNKIRYSPPIQSAEIIHSKELSDVEITGDEIYRRDNVSTPGTTDD